jgi:cytochrome c556
MQRFVMCAIALMVTLGATGFAQMKITSFEEYQKVMRSASGPFGATRKAIASGAFADAKTQLATAREGFATLQVFWTEQNEEEAVGILKTALTQIDALDKMLSMATPNQEELLAQAKQVQGACGACHKMYREGENPPGFTIRGVTF